MFDGPALPPLHSGVEHEMAVLALEAVDVIIPPESSDPGSLTLTFLREDGQLAGATAQCELSVRLSELFNKLLDEENNLSLLITISLTDQPGLTCHSPWCSRACSPCPE